MRRVLVVSPHFPPTDTVDMHRVRMTVGHYRENGWEPTVLSVRPELTGRGRDPVLDSSVPAHVERSLVGATPVDWARLLGLSAIGFRAWPQMDAGGRALLKRDRFDLVFISTTAFPLMSLGRAWKRRFGVPFVLDFQDPWATFPASAKRFIRRGVKHRVMQTIHRRLEARTVPYADGLMAVSREYIDLLRERYPAVRDRPAAVSPFGYSAADFALSAEYGRTPYAKAAEDEVTVFFAGRIAPAMEASVRAFLRVVAAGRRRNPALFGRFRVRFVGTGYQPAGNPPVAMRLAEECGMEAAVDEQPDRVSLMDALKGMSDAGLLLVFGSDTGGYVPSKLNQSLALPKPIVCVAPAASPLHETVRGMDGVLFMPADDEDIDALAEGLERLLREDLGLDRRALRVQRYEAAACARLDCELFDAVVEQARPSVH